LSRLPRATAREVVAALRRAGFEEVRQRGSHLHLYHPDRDTLVTVSMHSATVKPKTLTSILRQAGLTAQELRELI
jgi:predicted RNA binding protein YcfA (HicA-like mRNA interferase family)